MPKILKQPKFALPIVALLVLLVLNFDEIGDGLTRLFASTKPPLLVLDGKSVEVSRYQYLGSWFLPDGSRRTGGAKSGRYNWRDVVRLNFEGNGSVPRIDTTAAKLDKTTPRQLTPDTEARVFNGVKWKNNQVSVFAFRGHALRKQVALLEIDTDNSVALYVNGKLAREMSGVDNVEAGANLLIPVSLEAGENLFHVKVFSNAGPPRMRMSLTLDQSKDFQAAWNISWGFLNKQMFGQSGESFEAPVVRWDALLNRMAIGIEVSDVLTGKMLMKRENARNGNVIREGGKALGEGIYRIKYKSYQPEQETFEECFLVGSPRKALESLSGGLDALDWSAEEKLNIEAQLKRAEILFRDVNYVPGDKEWEEKALYTLASLSEFVNLKKHGMENIFKNLRGLQFRGFLSKIDNSRQFYRLFVPSNHAHPEKLPVILIMPTAIAATQRSFLESPFAASHREAVKLCKFAEKFGFAILWPGYRNAPLGWTYESVHAEETLADVEANYNVDSSRISLYGTCSGSFLAGRLAATYPKRFAAIVHDRALFEKDVEDMTDIPNSLKEWFRSISPVGNVIENRNLKILVLHNGVRAEGHGEIELTRKFLETALPKRPDIAYVLGQRKIGVGLWDSIYRFLSESKNEHPDRVKSDVPARSGYTGPISEVFGTPFIVVEGTRTSSKEAIYMDAVIKNLKALYQKQFHHAEFVLKKDIDVTEEEMRKCSLVLLGNAKSNVVWEKMAAAQPDVLIPYRPPESKTLLPFMQVAFAEVFKNPLNKNNYLLLIGADKLENMEMLLGFDPFQSWFDCYMLTNFGGRLREYTTARRP